MDNVADEKHFKTFKFYLIDVDKRVQQYWWLLQNKMRFV